MSTDRFAIRRSKLLRSLRRHRVDGLLVTNSTNVTYLTGFTGGDSFLLVGQKRAILISDGRFAVQIGEECPDLEVEIRPSLETIVEATARVAKSLKLTRLGFESNSTTVQQFESLQQQIKSLETVSVAAAVENLRAIKDAEEVTEIRQAVIQAQRGFDVLRASLTGDMTELESAHLLEHAMRRFGALRASFEPIVAVGSRAALPHCRPSEHRLCEASLVLIDWGASNGRGYKSDLTRVLATGKISTKLSKIYRVVLRAQLQAIEAIRPGVRGCDVDAVARSIIEEAGYGKNFGHGLGHGIGLDIHEMPRLSPAGDSELKAGMVVTVEPGIYLPGWGGVRIEDDVLVTRNGCEVLSSVPKNLQDIVLG